MWLPNRSDTNRLVQAQKRARSLKFRILVEEEFYYPSSENKGADQLSCYADCWFSHETAQVESVETKSLDIIALLIASLS